MNSIKLNVSGKNVTLNLPTSVTEISEVYLDEVTKHIKVAPEYSLVAIVFKSSLPMLLNTNKGKEENASVITLFVKAGETDSDFIKGIDTKDILVITGSNISLGIHINNPFNQLSLSKLMPLLNADRNIGKTCFADRNTYCFVEFKLIPNCNINGVLGTTNDIKCDYIEYENTEQA